MITEASDELAGWVRTAVAPVVVDLEPPAASATDAQERVSCYLYGLTWQPAPRGLRRARLQAELKYVVTASAGSAARANALLDLVIGAVAARDDLDLDIVALDPEFWRAFGITPRPAVLLSATRSTERPSEVAAPALSPLRVDSTRLAAVSGRVVSTHGIAVAAAEVRLRGHPVSGWTDSDGRFTFTALPPTIAPRHFEVRARGRRFELTSTPDGDPAAEVALIIDPIGGHQ